MECKVVTVAQQKGGSGKTTFAANIAVALALAGKKVAILDTDPQGSLGRWYMLRKETGKDEKTNFGFRTASAWGARYESRELAKTHDYVIIDTPPKMGTDGRPAIEASDLVVIPVTPSHVDLWATEPTIAVTKEMRRPALLVMNRASMRTKLANEVRTALDGLDCACADTVISNRIAYAQSMGAGQAVMEHHWGSTAALEIAALMAELEQHLHSDHSQKSAA